MDNQPDQGTVGAMTEHPPIPLTLNPATVHEWARAMAIFRATVEGWETVRDEAIRQLAGSESD